jgi:hypothetical protein
MVVEIPGGGIRNAQERPAMNEPLPSGILQLTVRGGYLMAREDVAAWASEQIQAYGSLERFAQQQPEARELSGRGPAYRIPLRSGGFGLVRKLRHGGLLAGITADRFIKRGVPRPINELLTSAYLRGRGIDTPEVLAACVYEGTGYYRGEVMRAFLSDCTDLAEFLLDLEQPEGMREQAVAAAAHLAVKLAHSGVCHTDFNAKNILVKPQGNTLSVLVIDLEKSARCPAPSPRAAWRMRSRLLGSLEKLEAHSRWPLGLRIGELLAEAPARD